MRRLLLALFFSLLLVPGIAGAQEVRMTPALDLGLKPQKMIVPAKFKGLIDSGLTVNLPEGFRARIFQVGRIKRPRFMAWGPDSILHVVCEYSKVWALPDRDHDGVADTALMVADNIVGGDIEFHDGVMYADGGDRILKLEDLDKDGIYETRSTLISNLPSEGYHPLHSIVVDPERGKIYVTTGSSCNVCREERRAIIGEYDLDGTGGRTFARGTRNPVGIVRHPRTGRLWATNNGSDNMGNDIPPEWIDLVRDGGFYGYPYAYADKVYFNLGPAMPGDYRALLPLTTTDSAFVRSMVQPAALVLAHSAPLAIDFANGSFPGRFRNGAFVALHGSWNRYPASGHKVVYLGFESDADTTADYIADFFTGFMTDSLAKPTWRWGRPAGIAVDHRSNLYVGSDEPLEFIAIVSPTSTNGVPAGGAEPERARLHRNTPNPVVAPTFVRFSLPRAGNVRLRLFSSTGDLAALLADGRFEQGENSVELDPSRLPSGVYLCRLRWEGGEEQETMVILH